VWASEPIVERHRCAEKATEWEYDQPKKAGGDEKKRFQQNCADGGRAGDVKSI